MDHIGKDAKNRLHKRLDECLMWATKRLGQQSHSPDITNIYKLQALIKMQLAAAKAAQTETPATQRHQEDKGVR